MLRFNSLAALLISIQVTDGTWNLGNPLSDGRARMGVVSLPGHVLFAGGATNGSTSSRGSIRNFCYLLAMRSNIIIVQLTLIISQTTLGQLRVFLVHVTVLRVLLSEV